MAGLEPVLLLVPLSPGCQALTEATGSDLPASRYLSWPLHSLLATPAKAMLCDGYQGILICRFSQVCLGDLNSQVCRERVTQEAGGIHLQRHACSTLSAWILPQIDNWASFFYSGRLFILPATIDYCLLCELLGGFWESPTRIRTSGDPSTRILTTSPCVLWFPYPPKPARQERGACSPWPGLPQ